MFSREWTDLPGDDIGAQYVMEAPEPAWQLFERLARKRREGAWADLIDRGKIVILPSDGQEGPE